MCAIEVMWYFIDRSAREAEDREKQAVAKGETLPTEQRFDSNCITPGTHSNGCLTVVEVTA